MSENRNLTGPGAGPTQHQGFHALSATQTKEFSEFFRVFFPRILTRLIALGAERSEAEDVATETFVTYLGLIQDDRLAEIDNWEGYLFKVARRSLFRRKLRANQLYSRLHRLESVPVAPRPSPEASAEVRLVLDTVKLLPPRQAAVLALTIDGFKFAEIAQILDIKEATVRSHLRNARAELKSRLGEPGDWSGVFSSAGEDPQSSK